MSTVITDEFDLTQIDKMVDVVNSEVMKKEFIESKNTIQEQKENMLSQLSGLTADKDFIVGRLNKYPTVEKLRDAIKTDESVIRFYTDDDGNEIQLAIQEGMDKKRSIEFRRDLLLYLKLSDVESAKIDAEYEKLEQATQEFQLNIDDACTRLSDNVLAYAGQLKDKAEVEKNPKIKAKILKSVTAIESAFYLTIYNDILDKVPSITTKVKKELEDDVTLARVGDSYARKLNYTLLKSDRPTKVSLVPFISDPEMSRLSFEQQVLLPDDYTTPDVFIYSLVRYFSMADWNDPSTRQAHATIVLVIKKLLTNELDPDLAVTVKENIKNYIARFN